MAKKTKSEQKPIENYTHTDKERVNNPPVGLVTPRTDPDKGEKKIYQYDPHLDPQLQWTGKAEHTSFDVPTVSLHVHERIDSKTIVDSVKKAKDDGGQQGLFSESLPFREAIEFYKHKENWANRLIAGDSLLVMNSLLEKEGMAGKVQMVYFDPPYGIKYGSNFQPFVNKRDVKDGKDEDLTSEPETIKAFRDTWELGIHSYLTYLRDRLVLSRELLAESGSIFVQISDENVHHVREIMDEVFGAENFVSMISYATTTGLGNKFLDKTGDYIIWYGKEKSATKYNPIWLEKTNVETGDNAYRFIELETSERRAMTNEEKNGLVKIPKNAKIFRYDNLVSQSGGENGRFPILLNGETYGIDKGSWKTNESGIKNLISKNRIGVIGNTISYIRFINDFPLIKLTNIWSDTSIAGFASDKKYVVQTSPKVIQRCILMTTDPSDLVLDITCGSGTTAYVAEQWGRRWITCDTSRVALTLAKQRLMTANFDYYQLARPSEGVSSGFVYKTVPHVTLKSIANNEPPATETLYDQPLKDNRIARITSPFTVEAVPAAHAKSVDELLVDSDELLVDSFEFSENETNNSQLKTNNSQLKTNNSQLKTNNSQLKTNNSSISRSGETHRQSEWRDELLKTGVRAKNGGMIEFSRIETLAGAKFIQAIAETKEFLVDSSELPVSSSELSVSSSELPVSSSEFSENNSLKTQNSKLTTHNSKLTTNHSKPKTVLIVFGSEFAPLDVRTFENAWQEARLFKPDILLFCAFQFDEEAAKNIDELNADIAGMQLLKAQMNADLLTDDLRKKRSSNESFWLIGQPDVKVDSFELLVFSEKVVGSYDLFKKLSGLNSLAEISQLSDQDLQLYLLLSQGRDVWHYLANEAGWNVYTSKYSGRASKTTSKGIPTIPVDSARFISGIRDLHHHFTEFGISDISDLKRIADRLRGNSQITVQFEKIFRLVFSSEFLVDSFRGFLVDSFREFLVDSFREFLVDSFEFLEKPLKTNNSKLKTTDNSKLKTTDNSKLKTQNYCQVEVLGFDYYNPKTGNIDSGGKQN
jgi:adenine-specific DNA-methyltransferase